MSISLDGKWTLYFFEQKNRYETPDVLHLRRDVKKIECNVPGNVELDLAENGYLPKDLYMGMNIMKTEDYEPYEWWYEKSFAPPANTKNLFLRFEAVDCFAEYYLNGEKIGESDNMFTEVEFDISERVKTECDNHLLVRIRSAAFENNCCEQSMYSLINSWAGHGGERVNIRKAAHSFGWDIMPRALSAGIWRSVSLINKDDIYFEQVFCCTQGLEENCAHMRVAFNICSDKILSRRKYFAEVSGKCGDSEFKKRISLYFKACTIDFDIENPRLWFPYGYGEANIYDAVIRLYENETLICEKSFRTGVRTLVLERTNTTDGVHGKFQFVINGVPVMCKGSNWVPLDVFHSRDAQRYERALNLVKDIGCNILRCWGGNVYEDTYFYDFCDRNGIMVWQDFSMACSAYPPDEKLCKSIAKEAELVIKKLRNHPCIILWSGDNECDESMYSLGANPNNNVITREIIPKTVNVHDGTRPYLASSPFICDEIFESRDRSAVPEEHLWGARDYFKSPFYVNSKAHFVSETGYHGCPSRKSIEKFIEKDYVENYIDNPQWILHSTDINGNDSRAMLMHKQIIQYFGSVPDNFDDYTLASQISQAEAKKFFIERIRLRKPATGGIIWWNLLDGWPQMSDAVVDYYFEKKLAYDYIKRSQAPFSIMASEINEWCISIFAENDTLEEQDISYEVYDIDTNEVYLSGKTTVCKNGFKNLGKIAVMYSEHKMLVIKWTANGKAGFNHYTCGMPGFSFEKYKQWLKKLNEVI